MSDVTAAGPVVDLDAFADTLIETGSIDRTARALKITPTVAKAITRNTSVSRLLRTKRKTLIDNELASMAIETLRRAMHPSQPANVQLKAALATLALAGHSAKEASEADRRLEDMTGDELAAFIRQASNELGDRPGRAKPVSAA